MKSLEILRKRIDRVIEMITDENETTKSSKILIRVNDIPLKGTTSARGMLLVQMWPNDDNNRVLTWSEIKIMNRYFNCIEKSEPIVIYLPKGQIMMEKYYNYK